jgi:hypothetical protein
MPFKYDIPLIHESYGDEVQLNRPRMDSTTNVFDQKLLLGLEYVSVLSSEHPPASGVKETNPKKKK